MNEKKLFSVEQMRRRARARLPRMVSDFLEGGALDERTLRRNLSAFEEVLLRQRVMVDLGEISTSTQVLGQQLSVPMIVSPMGLLTVCHSDADAAVARAAANAGSLMIHSPWSGVSIEETFDAANGRLWEQIAFWKQPAETERHLARARNLGVDTIVIAGDVAVSSRRERDVRHGTSMPPKPPLLDIVDVALHPGWVARWLTGRKMTWGTYEIEGRAIRMSEMEDWMASNENTRATWEDISEIRRKWDGRILVKGIMTPEDAELALNHGADGIFVSNHGGRQFDGQPSTLEALPAIVDAVNGRGVVVFDGGVRRGSDIVAALAAGADLVAGGRSFAYGLAAGGLSGVERVFAILTEELKTAMGFVGATSTSELGAHSLARLKRYLQAIPAPRSGQPVSR